MLKNVILIIREWKFKKSNRNKNIINCNFEHYFGCCNPSNLHQDVLKHTYTILYNLFQNTSSCLSLYSYTWSPTKLCNNVIKIK